MKFKQLLQKAQKENFAIGAFNAANLETLKAIFNAAKKLKSPVIVESSPGEADYIGVKNLVALCKNFTDETGISVFVNLDHAQQEDKVYEAAQAGFDLLHFDGSKLKVEENIKRLRQVVKKIHKQGKLVEGEMDHITGSSEPNLKIDIATKQQEVPYTDPLQAKLFVHKTNCDILAVFIGNVHGVYKNPPKLDFKRFLEIKKQARCFFSLHGGSGILSLDLKKAVKSGVVKVNVNTELRMAYRQALEKSLKQYKKSVKVYEYMQPVIAAVQKVVEEKIKIFGSVNKS